MTAELVETPCIRRWFSVCSTCPCQPCSRARRLHRKLNQVGSLRRVPSDQAWVVLDGMVERGWTPAAIASATGVPARSVTSMFTEDRAGHRRRIGPTIARMIVEHGEPSRGYIGADATRRKVRALHRVGWTGDQIGDAAGLGWTTISAVRNDYTVRVTPRVAAAVDRAWQALQYREGTSGTSRLNAARQGWPPPIAYDDIDAPDAAPVTAWFRIGPMGGWRVVCPCGRDGSVKARHAKWDCKGCGSTWSFDPDSVR